MAVNFSNFDSASSFKDIDVNFKSCGRPGYELNRCRRRLSVSKMDTVNKLSITEAVHHMTHPYSIAVFLLLAAFDALS